MARVLVVQHTAAEGLGNFFTWLPEAGLDVHPIHPYLGHRMPTVVEGDALIVLGSPASAYDDESTPWLPATRDLLRSAVEDGVPTLGICLGAQLLARACGGEVESPASEGPELGLSSIEVLVTDELFGPPQTVPVIQWHHDIVRRLPDDAVVCASGALYPNQAFRLGDVAWGVQFHPEATVELVSRWAESDVDDLAALGLRVADAVGEVRAAQVAVETAGLDLARRFAALVTG